MATSMTTQPEGKKILFYYFGSIHKESIDLYCPSRFLRDAKLYEIGAGTSEVRRLVIGRAINAEYK